MAFQTNFRYTKLAAPEINFKRITETDPKMRLFRYMFDEYQSKSGNVGIMSYWESGLNWGIALLMLTATMFLAWAFGG